MDTIIRGTDILHAAHTYLNEIIPLTPTVEIPMFVMII